MQQAQQPRPGFGGAPGASWPQQGPPQLGPPRPKGQMGAMPPQQGMMPHQQMPPQSVGAGPMGFPPHQPQVLVPHALCCQMLNCRSAVGTAIHKGRQCVPPTLSKPPSHLVFFTLSGMAYPGHVCVCPSGIMNCVSEDIPVLQRHAMLPGGI